VTISETVRTHYDAVRAASVNADILVAKVVQEFAGPLNEFIDNCETYLNEIRDGVRPDFDNSTLERMAMRLPILLYRLSDGVDRSAIESTVAKAAVDIVFDTNYLKAVGTIPERKAIAALQTTDETQVVELTKHVYNRLKAKIEHANSLFDAIRKVMTSRDTDKNVFRRETAR
jgi:hypothetical protein